MARERSKTIPLPTLPDVLSRLFTRLDLLLEYIAREEERKRKTEEEILYVLNRIAVAVGAPPVVPPIPKVPIPKVPIPKVPLVPPPEWKPMLDFLVMQFWQVAAKPTGPVRHYDKVTTTATFQTVAEITPSTGTRFYPAKIIVACLEDVEAQLFWDGKVLGPMYKVMGKLPFTDWFPFDYQTLLRRKLIGNGKIKLELKVRYPTGGTAAECYGEISGEEV